MIHRTFQDRYGYNGVRVVNGEVAEVWVGNFHEGGVAYRRHNPSYGTLQSAFDKLFFFAPSLHAKVLAVVSVPVKSHAKQVALAKQVQRKRLNEEREAVKTRLEQIERELDEVWG